LLTNAGAHSKRDVVRSHVRAPPYVSYPRRALTPRCRNVQRSMHCAGGLLCMTSMAAGMVPSGEAALAGAPPAARHCPPGQPHVAEHCRPHRACTDHRGDPTSSQPTSHDYIDKSPTAPRARPTAARASPPAIGTPLVSSLLRPLPWPTPKPSPCTHRAYMRVCWPNRRACSPEPELPRLPPGSHRRARPSAGSPGPGTHLAPSLGHMEATRAAHC
jgi:hypothetical protein